MILVVIQRVQGELKTMCLKIYYEHAKDPFSVVGCCSDLGFSMPPKGSVVGFICQNESFSSCIARLAIAGSEQSSLRRLVSACSNMAFTLYGTVCYGSN